MKNIALTPCKVCMGPIYKIHNIFIDFYFPFVYDNIAKYGMLYFVGIAYKYGISQRKYYERGFTHYGKS